ncbi:MAG: caspase family protein [Candidatus Methanofastidiosia archaeon]
MMVLGMALPSCSLAQKEAPCWYALVVGVGDFNGDGDYVDRPESPGKDNNGEGDYDDPGDEKPIDNNGDGDYNDPGDLDGPRNDIIKVKQTLPRWGFDKENITIKKDKEAKKEEIMKTLEELVKKANEEECCVFFYFSGHGMKRDDDNGDESRGQIIGEDKKDEGIVLFDGVLWDDDLTTIVSALEKDKGRMIIEIDCCFSRGMIDFVAKNNMVVGWSCKENECSRSMAFQETVNGAWTHYVFKKAFQDDNADGIMNADGILNGEDGRACIEEANEYGKNCQNEMPRRCRIDAKTCRDSAKRLRGTARIIQREDGITAGELMKTAQEIDYLADELEKLADKLEKREYENVGSICEKISNESAAIVEELEDYMPSDSVNFFKELSEAFKEETDIDSLPQTPGYEDGNEDEEICCGLDPVCSGCFN